MKRVFYFIADIFFIALAKLPKPILYSLSNFLFLIFFFIVRYRKKIVLENIKNSYPKITDKERKKIAKKYYQHLCDLVLEDLALIKMSKKRILSFTKFTNPEILQKYYELNKNIIMVFGHYSNWEFLSPLPLYTSYKFLPVYKKINNEYINTRFINTRSLFGAIPVRMEDTLKVTLNYFNKKEPIILGLIADQRPRKRDVNYWMSFFNQDTPVFIGPEKIGKKINATIIFADIEKEKRGFYNINFSVICDDPKNTSDFEITKKFFKKMEDQITTNPEYWTWSHKRWKYNKDKFAKKTLIS